MMRRTEMNRGTGFKRRAAATRAPARSEAACGLPPDHAAVEHQGPTTPARAARRGTYAAPALAAAIPKVIPVGNERYRRLVALLPCKLCGIDGFSQAAHPNTGKGAGTKTDDRLCFPLCCDRPGVRGCHPQFDQHALMTKAARRLIEPAWGADTRRQIVAMGLWPKGLAHLSEGDCNA